MESPKAVDGSPSSKKSSTFFVDDQYTQDFMQKLLHLQKQEQYTNMTLKTDDLEIPCHWIILSAASEYFHGMYRSGMKESRTNVVPVTGIDSATLKTIIKYIYTAEIVITQENVQNLIQASDLFQFEGLKSKCESFMQERIDTSNTIGFYHFSQIYHLENLRKDAREVMLNKFSEVVAEEEFSHLSIANLIEYITDDELCVSNEDLVFESVMQWVKYNQDERAKFFSQIISNIRLPYCSSNYLCHTVEMNELMSSPECQGFLREARMFKLMTNHQNEISSIRTKPRLSFKIESTLVVVGGFTNHETGGAKPNECCWYLRESTSSWELLTVLPVPNHRLYGVCTVNNGILITGGVDGQIVRNDCWFFETQEQKWKPMPSMIEPRFRHCALVLGRGVYILGGTLNNSDPLCTVEYLDIHAKQWETVPPMTTSLMNPMAVTSGQYIYVLGGVVQGTQVSADLHLFDSVTKSWKIKTKMPHPCPCGTAIALNQKLYLFGGIAYSFHCYDPSEDSWTKLNPPSGTLLNASAILWREKILLSGAAYREKTSLIEEYTPETNEWSCWNVRLKKELSSHHLFILDLYGVI